MMSIAKRNFVLMEVMLAFALICFSILPFLRYPALYMKKDLSTLLQTEAIYKVEERATQLHIDLFDQKIDESRLFVKKLIRQMPKRKPLPISLGKWKRTYYIEELVRRSELKKSNDGLLTSKVHITVRLFENEKDKLEDALYESHRIAVAQKHQ